MSDQPFWQTKALDEMSQPEWESLCDGCARCCMHKLEDEDTGEVHYTSIVCRYLDQDKCQCTDYPNRNVNVPECVLLTPAKVDEFGWLPDTCAYRLIAEGKDLYDWHPLVSGDPGSVQAAGISVTGKVIDERSVHPDSHQEYIVRWVSQ
jgi:uncharacterized cysteine cluster protein YcgN (CxxCxxCC family)